MDGGATAALLVLAVLLVGVPRMSRRRAELGSWHAAGRGDVATAPSPVPVPRRPRPAGRRALVAGDDGVRPVRAADAAVVGDALAVGPGSGGTGLRRSTPGARVLVRRSAVPRPRCAPGSSSRPVLAGRPTTPVEASSELIVVAGVAVETPGPVEARTGATTAPPALLAAPPSVPAGSTDVGRSVPGAEPGPARGPATGPAPAPAPGPAPGVARPRRSGPGRADVRPARHLARLGATAALALVVAVLAVLGVVPALAAAVLPALLVADVVVLRRRAVRVRAHARAVAREAARRRTTTVGVVVEAPPAGAAATEDGDVPPGSTGGARTGAVTGLLPSLADLRAAAAADAAPGLRGPATPPRARPAEPAPAARPAPRRRRRSA